MNLTSVQLTLLYFTLLLCYFTLSYVTACITLLYVALLCVTLLYPILLHFTFLYFSSLHFTLPQFTSLHFTLPLSLTVLYFSAEDILMFWTENKTLIYKASFMHFSVFNFSYFQDQWKYFWVNHNHCTTKSLN